MVFWIFLVVLRNSHPMTGMSPRIGTLFTVSTVRFWIRPPMTTVSPSLATTVVLALRLEVVGPSTRSVEAISSVCSWMSRRTKSLSLICGLTLSLSSTFCRWIGA